MNYHTDRNLYILHIGQSGCLSEYTQAFTSKREAESALAYEKQSAKDEDEYLWGSAKDRYIQLTRNRYAEIQIVSAHSINIYSSDDLQVYNNA